MTEPTPVATLRAAAERLRQPISPDTPAIVAPALVGPMARVLEHAAQFTSIYVRLGGDHPETAHQVGPAIDTARAILALADQHRAPAATPHGPQDAPTADGAGPQPEHGASGPQAGAQARDCPACDARIPHDECCPTPETHNWGCGCATDQAPAAELRDRIETALLTTPATGHTLTPGHERFEHHPAPDQTGHSYTHTCALCRADVHALTDALLAVLQPELADRERLTLEIANQRETFEDAFRQEQARAERAEAQVRAVREAAEDMRDWASATPRLVGRCADHILKALDAPPA